MKELIQESDEDELRCVSKEFIDGAGLSFVLSDIADMIEEGLGSYISASAYLTEERKAKLKRVLSV